MKFYYAANSCAIGVHVVLEELGINYEAVGINLAEKQQLLPEYRAVNPKTKVPALVRDDGSLLTEFQAIVIWLARAYPEKSLWPQSLEEQTRTMELLDFIVASLHMRAFTFISVAAKFSPSPEAQADLKAHGLAQAEIGFEYLSSVLGDKEYFMGTFGLVDAAMFYITHWAIRAGVQMPENLASHHNRMSERASVQRALKGENMTELKA